MIILFLELLSLCTYRYSNCINKTHTQAIRINFFSQVDIFQVLFSHVNARRACHLFSLAISVTKEIL